MAFASFRIMILFALLAGGPLVCACRSTANTAAKPNENSVDETLHLDGAKFASGIVEYANLRYQQCSHGQTPRSDVCVGEAVSVNHFRARRVCEDLRLGNLRWRLPAREELEALLLKNQSFVPLTDPRAFPRPRAVNYWTDSA